MMRSFFSSLLVAALFGAAAHAAPAAHDGWVRLVPGQKNAAGYLALTNSGPAEEQLVSAHADGWKAVEIHDMVMEGELMRMRKVDAVAIPAGGKVTFGPMGHHLMFIGLSAPLADHTDIPVTLRFASGTELLLPMTVKSVGTTDRHKKHGKH